MDISKWAFKNRNLVYFLVTVLFVGGILSCYQMSNCLLYTSPSPRD